MSNRTFTTDNRFSPESSGATVPADALAAYSARWIDQGDHTPADIVPDRQGFGYDDSGARDVLIARLVADDAKACHQSSDRDTTDEVADHDGFHLVVRRSGGYVYVDAWTTA